jgi:2-oxoglutarate ferredoxin oxidoreductase subunit alpha
MVVNDVQRGGATTGIPSKSEQSDLNHAIYGGHGDAPRVVMAPYDIEGCYRLVIESFNIAEGFQVPVLLLSDQWLGQTSTAVSDEFMKKDYRIVERKKPARQASGDYLRYQVTDDFISPMSVAGDEGAVYQATGLTHKENGRPAFDFKTQQSLHEKRWKKLIPLQQRDELVKVFGNEASTKGIITWGSSALVVLDALKSLGLQDEVKVCVPELIYPLPEMVERFIKATKRLLVVEMNYSGQLHGYLRSQLQLPRNTKLYARAGGRPFSREELAKPIAKMAR